VERVARIYPWIRIRQLVSEADTRPLRRVRGVILGGVVSGGFVEYVALPEPLSPPRIPKRVLYARRGEAVELYIDRAKLFIKILRYVAKAALVII